MSEPDVTIKPFDALSLRELYAILHLRDLVFVVGQKITSEPEVDGRDPECSHAMLWEGDTLVATARLFLHETPRLVGRVAVHPDRQRQGLGSVVMREVQRALDGGAPAELHAQAHLEAWYTRLGWRRVGEVFMEAQIPHVHMVWPSAA